MVWSYDIVGCAGNYISCGIGTYMEPMILNGMLRVPLVNLSEIELEKLKKEYVVEGKSDILELWDIDEKFLYLPWSAAKYFDGNSIVDVRTDGRAMSSLKREAWVPRDGQEHSVRMLNYHFSMAGSLYRGGTLVAPCGSGKTVMGAEFALRWGRKTAILVHKEYLARQWESSFRMLSPEIKIGRVQQKRCEFENNDVVIMMCGSLLSKVSGKHYPSEMYNAFGVLICDEVHRYGATTWHGAIKKFTGKVRLGLTATFRRSDGRIGVIGHHIGGVIHQMKIQTLPVIVYFVKVGTLISTRKYTNRWNNEVNWGRLITMLAENESRNRIIGQYIVRALRAGRKVLVLSERLNQLKMIALMTKENGLSEDNIGFFVGGKKEQDLDIAAMKPLILATYQMARDSLDIPRIDTLFLGTPVADIEQSVGRIVRPSADKKRPIVVDFVDKLIGVCTGLANARDKQYKVLNYKIG